MSRAVALQLLPQLAQHHVGGLVRDAAVVVVAAAGGVRVGMPAAPEPVQDVEEDLGALDVPEKLVAQALCVRRSDRTAVRRGTRGEDEIQ